MGSAIAASLAAAGAAGAAAMSVFDARAESALGLAQRLSAHHPALAVTTGSNDPAGFEIVVNATPMAMATATRCRSRSRAYRPRPLSARW